MARKDRTHGASPSQTSARRPTSITPRPPFGIVIVVVRWPGQSGLACAWVGVALPAAGWTRTSNCPSWLIALWVRSQIVNPSGTIRPDGMSGGNGSSEHTPLFGAPGGRPLGLVDGAADGSAARTPPAPPIMPRITRTALDSAMTTARRGVTGRGDSDRVIPNQVHRA